MSIRIMSAVFENETLKPTEKLILLALADHADDSGRCYPSIGRLAKRTCLSERALQTNIRSLEDQGYITIHKGGGRENTNVYFVKANPAGNAPIEKGNPASPALNPASPALNPAAYAPEPSITIKEPSEKNIETPLSILCRASSEDAAASFLAYRKKTKGGAVTETAAKRILNSLYEIMRAGYDPDDALGMAEERGWQTVKFDWYMKEKRNEPRTNSQQSTPRPQDRVDPALGNIARILDL